jgi:hypothetical protein
LDISISNKLFREVCERLPELTQQAQAMPSPNPEDTYHVKLAVAGFSLYSSVDRWEYAHYQWIAQRLEHEIPHYEDEVEQRVACLFFGALLGKYLAESLSDNEVLLAEMHLPGLIARASGRIAVDDER